MDQGFNSLLKTILSEFVQPDEVLGVKTSSYFITWN